MEDEKENVVKVKARGTGSRGRGRECGHRKAASTSLPRPGKSKQEVTTLKKDEIYNPVGKKKKNITKRKQKLIGEQGVLRQIVIKRLD